MPMQPSHLTPLDDTLVHQVRFSTRNHVVVISCICRATTGQHEKSGKFYNEPIGRTANINESRRLYNDPKNHNAPFTQSDEAKW
jgi:hypothetical protein